MKKKKILFVIGSMGRGGKERRLQVLLKHFSENHEYEIHLIIMKDIIEYCDFMNYQLQYHIVHKNRVNYFKSFVALVRIVTSLKPDIIHAWSSIELTLIAPIAKLFKIPIINNEIAYAQDQNRLIIRLWRRFNFALSDFIIANSMAGIEATKPPKQKSTVIYNGFESSRFNNMKTSLKKDLGTPDNAILITMVAAFRPGKDYDSLVNIAKDIGIAYDDVFFCFVGDGQNRERIQGSCKEAHLCKVFFLGIRNDIEEILLDSDIGVLLNDTNISKEGLSNSIMEYMAAGLPVVATNAGGNPELLEHGKTGFLVENKNEKQITEYLKHLINDKELRVKMGNEGKNRIKNQFSIESFINKHDEVIRKFIK